MKKENYIKNNGLPLAVFVSLNQNKENIDYKQVLKDIISDRIKDKINIDIF